MFQVFRRDRQRDRVADGLVKSVIRAVYEQRREIVVGALVKIMAELVVYGREIFRGRFDAHFDPQVILIIDVPGARVADHLAVARLGE